MSIDCENLIDLDLSSLGYFSVIPKDVRQLIEKELLPDWILCKFVDKLYQEKTVMKLQYVRKDVILRDLAALIYQYFGNPLNFDRIKRLIREYISENKNTISKNPKISSIENLISGYMMGNQSIILDLYQILNPSFKDVDDVEHAIMFSGMIDEITNFILEEIFRTDLEMRQILLGFSHPLAIRLFSYFFGDPSKISINGLSMMKEIIRRYINKKSENIILEKLYERYKGNVTKYPKHKDFTDVMLNSSVWGYVSFKPVSRLVRAFFEPNFFDGMISYGSEDDIKKIKNLTQSETEKSKNILRKIVRMYYLNEVKKLHPEMLINPSFDFIYE